MDIQLFGPEHAEAVSGLCGAEGWDSWDDPNAVARALLAPGMTTLVALQSQEVIGAIQVLGDGEINWVIGDRPKAGNSR